MRTGLGATVARSKLARWKLSLLAGVSVLVLTAAAPPTGEVVPTAPAAGIHTALDLQQALIHTTYKPSAMAMQAAKAQAGLLSTGLVLDEGQGVHVEDEVIIMEGDDEIVTSFGQGAYGLRLDQQVQNPMRVTERLYEHFPDEFDFVVVWTTFWDYGADGLAYYVGIRNNTAGIGQQTFNNGWMWGSSAIGELEGFLNMKSINLYGDIADPDNYAYPVMGQEITHRYLAYLKFRRADGSISGDMLGRDNAHWSTLLHAYASVQDGNHWMDNDNGSFTLLGSMMHFSPLDLYALGLFDSSEVEPFFLIEDATYEGESYGGLTQFPVGITIQGSRTEITMDDVISAHGPRIPTFEDAQKEFRVAYVLVTRPNETLDDVWPEVQAVQTFRTTWDDKFEEWTFGRGTLCSRTSAACDLASLAVTDGAVAELDGDLDGMPEPGDTLRASLTITNDGGAPSMNSSATVVVPDGVDITVASPVLDLPDLGVGESATLEEAFDLELGLDAPCGTEVSLKLELKTQDTTRYGSLTFPIGFQDVLTDGFEEDGDWLVDPYGSDTASTGTWQRVVPVGVDGGQVGINLQTQPATDQSGHGMAWITGGQGGGDLGDDDIDEGTTTLVSPAFDLSDGFDPMLSYWSWRIGLDFNDPSGYIVAEDNDPLTVEISPDDGATWILVDEDISNEQAWLHKTVRLLDHLETPPAALRVRVIARDVPPQSLSEAGFDSLRLYELQPSCYGIFE